MNNRPAIFSLCLVCLLLMMGSWMSCNSDYTPKPRAYFKIDLPEKKYRQFDSAGYPFSFEYPVYGKVSKDSSLFDASMGNPFWINIDFPQFGGVVYLSYKTIGGNSIFCFLRLGGGHVISTQSIFPSGPAPSTSRGSWEDR